MKQRIIEDEEQSLDDLVVRAREDRALKKIIDGSEAHELIIAFGRHVKRCTRQGLTNLCQARGDVNSLAFFDNEVYYCDNEGNVLNLNDDSIMNFTSDIKPTLIYAQGAYLNVVLLHLANEPGRNEIVFCSETRVIKRGLYVDKQVTAMGWHEKELVYACGNEIFGVAHYDKKEHLICFSKEITAMCSFNGLLWFNHENEIWNQNADEKYQRKSKVKALCVHDGMLYDAGEYGIYLTQENKKVHDACANAMISIPKNEAENSR
jgi:hypothetical protein